MKKINILAISTLIILVFFGLGVGLKKETQVNALDKIPDDMKKVTLYKDPNCGCCDGHTKMYEDAGFEVEVVNMENVFEIKNKHNLSIELASCHTAIMGDYIVEGHVPLEGIEMLVNERPAIRGIALPGMPIGTPGMPGLKTETFKIKDIDTKEVILEI